MKFFLLIIFILTLVFFASREFPGLVTVTNNASQSASPATAATKIQSIDFENQKYSFLLTKVSSLDKLFLYPNFEQGTNARELFTKNSCATLTSGGFYTKENQAVGLFISEGKTYREQNKNALFNGIFSLTYDNKPAISDRIVIGSTRFALQSGPVLLENGDTRALKLTNDETARRMVAALDRDGNVVFIAIFNKASEFLGPNLVDLPRIVEAISNQLNLNLVSAVNLDGGTASAYYENTTSLSEASPIGSFFCVKK